MKITIDRKTDKPIDIFFAGNIVESASNLLIVSKNTYKANSMFEGFCINSDSNNTFNYSTNWPKNMFEQFKGTITINP